MKLVPIHDIIAGVIAIGLLVVIGILAILQQPIPEILSLPFVSSVTWALRGGVQAGNELRHRNKRPIAERLKALGYSGEDAEAIRKVINDT